MKTQKLATIVMVLMMLLFGNILHADDGDKFSNIQFEEFGLGGECGTVPLEFISSQPPYHTLDLTQSRATYLRYDVDVSSYTLPDGEDRPSIRHWVYDANGVMLAGLGTGFSETDTHVSIEFMLAGFTHPRGVWSSYGAYPTARPWTFVTELGYLISVPDGPTSYRSQDVYEETYTHTFDPADYNPECERLPYTDTVAPVNNDSSANEVSIFVSIDERRSPSLNVYDVDENGNGNYALTITQDDIAPFDGNPPSENTEILTSADGNIRVFVLNTGEIQINSGPDEEGKIHVVILDGIPPTSTYGYTIDPPSAD